MLLLMLYLAHRKFIRAKAGKEKKNYATAQDNERYEQATD